KALKESKATNQEIDGFTVFFSHSQKSRSYVKKLRRDTQAHNLHWGVTTTMKRMLNYPRRQWNGFEKLLNKDMHQHSAVWGCVTSVEKEFNHPVEWFQKAAQQGH